MLRYIALILGLTVWFVSVDTTLGGRRALKWLTRMFEDIKPAWQEFSSRFGNWLENLKSLFLPAFLPLFYIALLIATPLATQLGVYATGNLWFFPVWPAAGVVYAVAPRRFRTSILISLIMETMAAALRGAALVTWWPAGIAGPIVIRFLVSRWKIDVKRFERRDYALLMLAILVAAFVTAAIGTSALVLSGQASLPCFKDQSVASIFFTWIESDCIGALLVSWPIVQIDRTLSAGRSDG